MNPVQMEDEPTTRISAREQLQGLIKALEAGGYGVTQGSLKEGTPLVVEDLNPVMKVVTYGDPGVYRQWEARCLGMARFFRFFRMHSWGHMMEQAAYHFAKEKERHTIKLQKDRFRRYETESR